MGGAWHFAERGLYPRKFHMACCVSVAVAVVVDPPVRRFVLFGLVLQKTRDAAGTVIQQREARRCTENRPEAVGMFW